MMLNDKQIDRMLGKLVRYEHILMSRIFNKVALLPAKRFETDERFHSIPTRENFYRKMSVGDVWGGEHAYCWFKGTADIPEELNGQNVYIMPDVGGKEGFLWVEGTPCGIFTAKTEHSSMGNHYCDLLAPANRTKNNIDFAIEFYAGHYIIGSSPLETAPVSDFKFTCNGIHLCSKNQDIADFVFDLRTLNQMVEMLPHHSFRRGDIINCLTTVHSMVLYDIEICDEDVWRPLLAKACEVMAPVLAVKNSDSAPFAGIVGHSHMDTAWLWTIPETVKKCARTYANEISLMNQYPEFKFVQSSAYHTEMIRKNYPELFEMIKEKVAEGRYEPNGGVWVECDCNITSGESMIRQFLWGQKYTQKHFNYTADCFWLPDTFGYSGAIPQIMKGCHVDYFLTTKLSWNDTNKFPYETFNWKGIDGTSVLTHFNTIHCWPEPKSFLSQIDGLNGSNNCLQSKSVTKKRLISYGFGDGGGGPQFEMIEMARRISDLDGCPKSQHVNVGEFMRKLEQEIVNPPTHSGELYLELHRGTLTNQHTIKRNNRKAEQAIHDLEFITVINAIRDGKTASDTEIYPLLETLLVNQFHDILPGTCISSAHDQSYAEMSDLLEKACALTKKSIVAENASSTLTIVNTLGIDREELVYIDNHNGKIPDDCSIETQYVEDKLCIKTYIPAFGTTTINLVDGSFEAKMPFEYVDNTLITPFAKIVFEDNFTIKSIYDTTVNREVRGSGLPINTFLIAEDMPTAWDNWDVDADINLKYVQCSTLIKNEVVSVGALQFRMRNTYKLSDKSTLTQDMIFYADKPQIDFETTLDWNDKHRFLKVDFDVNVMSNTARHEIQFGHCQKPTTRNNAHEQAMFEVLNHKFTDLSEPRYGVAILNDCKYGVSVENSDIRLSLHKGGCRPDPRGDVGIHKFKYSILPHTGCFSAKNVVHPAYAFNSAPIVVTGERDFTPLIISYNHNVIIETIKPCEDNQKAFIVRIYECEGALTNADIKLSIKPQSLEITDMLEEVIRPLTTDKSISLTFKPFEIITLKVGY